MSKIDPKILSELKSAGINPIYSAAGYPVGWKGAELPDAYDNWTEAWRLNQDARRIRILKEAGLNEYGQTKEQAEEFRKKRLLQSEKKAKAELAAELALQNK